MRNISYNEFETLFKPIEQYNEDYQNNVDGLKLLFPDSYVTPNLGASLLDKYIDLLALYLEVDNYLISWFVFDNEYGENEKELNNTPICCLEDFYCALTNM